MRLSPDVFWAMSLGEWRAAVNGFARRSSCATPLARADLDRLMRMYPDHLPLAPTHVGERGRGEGDAKVWR
ncbi:MAG: phage tail assembly chaperone [Alphaproteobacteria bacterium]|jgi:uncharacterized phage protein (TIGR02216 family)